jgi:predicted AAA+ superfamily ATPase
VIERGPFLRRLRSALAEFPVVGLLGARQVGKTTLAGQLADRWPREVHRFDLEDSADLARLADPMLALRPLRGLVVVDEVQRRADLFPALRVLADRARRPARFLVLGSASPDLLRQSSESLAGRIRYLRLEGLRMEEVGRQNMDRLWLRGGFPRSYLAPSDAASLQWRVEFIETFLHRDLPQLGISLAAETLRQFWAMLAHYHGQLLNTSELGRALGVGHPTIARHLDALVSTFVVRRLRPWHENIKKRQVKSPKVYVEDNGLLHALLNLSGRIDLERHPKVGASWESFAMAEVVGLLGVRPEECWFWATHQGAELDLLIVRGRRRWGFEFKRTSAPEVTASMRVALRDLGLVRLDVIHAGEHSFPMAPKVRAIAARDLGSALKPLR